MGPEDRLTEVGVDMRTDAPSSVVPAATQDRMTTLRFRTADGARDTGQDAPRSGVAPFTIQAVAA